MIRKVWVADYRYDIGEGDKAPFACAQMMKRATGLRGDTAPVDVIQEPCCAACAEIPTAVPTPSRTARSVVLLLHRRN
jgi:hypothetical protein